MVLCLYRLFDLVLAQFDDNTYFRVSLPQNALLSKYNHFTIVFCCLRRDSNITFTDVMTGKIFARIIANKRTAKLT